MNIMRLRTPEKLKERQRKAKFKLKARSSRSSGGSDVHEEEDLYPEEEGNSMKLSHAFFVVLLLHIILIGGIFGFNYMKARQIRPISSSPAPQSAIINSAAEVPRTASSTEAKSAAVITDSAPENLHPPSLPPLSTTREEHQQMQEGAYKPVVVASQIAAPVVSANHAVPSAVTVATTTATATTAHPLKAPSAQEIHSAKGSVKKESRTSASGSTVQQKVYVVVAGDNPYSIARKFKINYVQLLSANHIQDPTKLQIGTKLKIPVKDQ